MTGEGRPRRRSVIGPLILILIGALFLAANFYPNFDPWWILARYWPLILIFIGVGKIWDSYWVRSHPDQGDSSFTGTTVGLIALALVLALIFWHGARWGHGRWNDRRYHDWGEAHDTQAVELQGAKSVSANIEIPAGTLTVEGGASSLLDADFRYDSGNHQKPDVEYSVSGEHGQLSVRQDQNSVQWGNSHNDWNLRFGNSAPLDMHLQMGAGQSNMRLSDVPVNRLKIEMGAGHLDLDLTGGRKSDLDADIQGGAGKAVVRLPKDVGVRVHASGGIGSVNASGLHREGDEYENDAYGKTPATIDMNIQGGVGEIDLIAQ